MDRCKRYGKSSYDHGVFGAGLGGKGLVRDMSSKHSFTRVLIIKRQADRRLKAYISYLAITAKNLIITICMVGT
jgi:hypothetical protein